jgi:hypothetical protein
VHEFVASRYIRGDSMSSLPYLWPLYIQGPEPATSGASGVKIWHTVHLGQAGRKGVRSGEEEGWSGGGGGRKLQ